MQLRPHIVRVRRSLAYCEPLVNVECVVGQVGAPTLEPPVLDDLDSEERGSDGVEVGVPMGHERRCPLDPVQGAPAAFCEPWSDEVLMHEIRSVVHKPRGTSAAVATAMVIDYSLFARSANIDPKRIG